MLIECDKIWGFLGIFWIQGPEIHLLTQTK